MKNTLKEASRPTSWFSPPGPEDTHLPKHPYITDIQKQLSPVPKDTLRTHLLVELLRVLWWQALGNRKLLLCASSFPGFSLEEVVEESCKTISVLFTQHVHFNGKVHLVKWE
jgi:hypothetical protein